LATETKLATSAPHLKSETLPTLMTNGFGRLVPSWASLVASCPWCK